MLLHRFGDCQKCGHLGLVVQVARDDITGVGHFGLRIDGDEIAHTIAVVEKIRLRFDVVIYANFEVVPFARLGVIAAPGTVLESSRINALALKPAFQKCHLP